MAEDTELDLASLDMQEGEAPAAPATPDPAPAAPAEPASQPRDPATGQFASAQPAAPAAPATPAPAAAPAPAPAAPAAAADPNANRVVPLAAHLAERTRWQQRDEQRQRELQALNERIAALEPKAAAPDFVEDPKGYVDAQTQAARDELKGLKDQAEQLQQQQQFGRFTQELGGHEAAFVQQNPDYFDALGHVRNIRMQQLSLMYPTATPEQIQQAIGQEELNAAYVFMQQGRNPAECAFEMAKALGYQRAAPPAPPAPPAAAPAAPAAAAPPPPPIPRAPVGDPSQTLGSSAAPSEEDEAGLGDEGDDGLANVNAALHERFGTRG